jgi:hypothetical protein
MALPNSLPETKKEILEKRLADLHQDYQAANTQLGRTIDDVERVRVRRRIDDLEQEIQQVESKLGYLRSSAVDDNNDRNSDVEGLVKTLQTVLGLSVGVAISVVTNATLGWIGIVIVGVTIFTLRVLLCNKPRLGSFVPLTLRRFLGHLSGSKLGKVVVEPTLRRPLRYSGNWFGKICKITAGFDAWHVLATNLIGGYVIAAAILLSGEQTVQIKLYVLIPTSLGLFVGGMLTALIFFSKAFRNKSRASS